MNGPTMLLKPASQVRKCTLDVSWTSALRRALGYLSETLRANIKGVSSSRAIKLKDGNGEVDVFQDLSSCPATMEAGNACDLFGSLEGRDIQQSDAEQAYTQFKLGGDPTWVRLILPREQWPEFREKKRDLVCPLILALYGHPDAGGYW